MSEEINISEEQVLHNKLNFEINQELIHLMKRIVELQQENQQLKEKIKLVESLASFNMSDNMPMVCMFKADYERNKYEYETIDKYKSVLDEIREYIETRLRDVNLTYGIDNEFREEYDDLLQILDKVKENESKRNV